MRVQRRARRLPVARRDLRQRQVERRLPVARLQRQHVGERLSRPTRTAPPADSLAQQHAIARRRAAQRDRLLGDGDRRTASRCGERAWRPRLGGGRCAAASRRRARSAASAAAPTEAAEHQGGQAEHEHRASSSERSCSWRQRSSGQLRDERVDLGHGGEERSSASVTSCCADRLRDRARQPQPQVALGVEAQREGGLALCAVCAAHSRADARRGDRGQRTRVALRRGRLDRHRRATTAHRRGSRSPARRPRRRRRARPAPAATRPARRRRSAHVVPAEIVRCAAAEAGIALRPHRRARLRPCARAGPTTATRAAWRHAAPRQPTTRRPKPPAGGHAAEPAARSAPRTRCGGNSSPAGRRYRSTAPTTSAADLPFGSTSMTVRPSIIDAAKSVRWWMRDRRDRAVLRQRDRGLGRDPRLGRRGVDDEDQRLARALAQVDGGADRAQIVRARPGRHDDQLGDLDHALDRHGDRRRRVDHRQLEALLAQHLQIGGEPRDGGLREGGILRLALVPPVGQRPLRIDVDQHDRAVPGALRLHGEMPGQGRLARSALSAMPSPERALFLLLTPLVPGGSATTTAKEWLTAG